ncbi:hypothetical protein D9M70_634070 [compost metagenome]
MDQRQRQADGQRGEAARCAAVGGAHDDEQEQRGENHFRHQCGLQAVAAGRVFRITVGGEAVERIEAGLAGGNQVQHRAGQQPAEYLRDDVWQ